MLYLKTFILLVVSIIITIFSQRTVDKKYKSMKNKEPLNDILIELFPNLDDYDYLCDYLAALPVLILLYVSWKNKKFTIMNDFIMYMAIIYILRSITMYFTILPSINCYHHKKINLMGGCCDSIFSGHTSVTLMSILFLIGLGFPTYIIIYPILLSFLIISSKSHYTVDVIISWYITFLVYISIKYQCVRKYFKNLFL